MPNKHGFTLVEILTAVIIVAILAVMAMPLYEKTIERSRMAEARTLMSRLQAAKLAAMDDMNCTSYVYSASSADCPRLEHLRVAFSNANGSAATGRTFSTKAFTYSLGDAEDTYPNGICAKRVGGDYDGTVFAYYQEGDNAVFKCKGSACDDYGLSNTPNLKCTF